MATLLDYTMFAGPYPQRMIAIHPAVDCSPMSKPVQGGPVYYRQPEVIQLVEVSAPPTIEHPSTITETSMPSSSSYSSSCSSEDESEDDEDCSSYCSSDPEEMEESAHGYYDDTYSTRLRRVNAWRDGFAKAMGAAITSGEHTPARSAYTQSLTALQS